MRLILLIHISRRTPKPTSVSYSNGEGYTVLTYDEGGIAKYALGRLMTVVDDADKISPFISIHLVMRETESVFAIPILKRKFRVKIGYSAFENGEYPFLEK